MTKRWRIMYKALRRVILKTVTLERGINKSWTWLINMVRMKSDINYKGNTLKLDKWTMRQITAQKESSGKCAIKPYNQT